VPLIAPTVPPQPADSADWQTRDIWLRRAAMANEAVWRGRDLAAREKHAQAQADTATNLAASVAAQNAATASFSAAPLPAKLSRAAMILDAMNAQPQVTAMTDLQQVKAATARVDALLATLPPGTAV